MIDIKTLLAASAFTLAGSSEVKAQNASNEFIGKQQPALQSDRMTPEALWAMGRIALLADPFGHGFCLLQFLGRGYDEISD